MIGKSELARIIIELIQPDEDKMDTMDIKQISQLSVEKRKAILTVISLFDVNPSIFDNLQSDQILDVLFKLMNDANGNVNGQDKSLKM